ICRSRPSTIPAGNLPPTPPVPAPPLPPRRPPSARPRKLRPAPATRRLQANDVPPNAPYDGPAVLGRPGKSVERLAAGAGHRLARPRPALGQRRRFRDYWTRISCRPTGGRPPLDAEIAALIRKMAAANPPLGGTAHSRRAPEAWHRDFLNAPSPASCRRAAPSPLRPGAPSSLTMSGIWSPSTSSPCPPLRLRILFVLVVLAHHPRRVVHFTVTEHPTAA